MMNEELIEKAKKARSAEQPSPKSDELSDDALDNVSGGYEQLGRTYAQLARTEKPKPSNNDTNELPDDALDIVSGGYETLRRAPSSTATSLLRAEEDDLITNKSADGSDN